MDNEERRKLIRALLLTVDEAWEHIHNFDEWWQTNYSWVRGEEDNEHATPSIGRREMEAALGAIARDLEIESNPRWAAALDDEASS